MKKYSLEFVRKAFDAENYTLISNTAYINGRQKFNYICPKGHRHSISFGKWLEGRRCPYCDGQGKPTIDFIKDEFANEYFILLTKKYINSKQKLEFICPNNHRYRISWHDWNTRGHRCPYCSGKYLSKYKIINKFKKYGYEVLKINDINKNDYDIKIIYRCPYGHINERKWAGIGVINCPTCAYIKKSGAGHPNWKGGISCEPYCDVWADKEYKESIKERDNYQCQNPYCWETSNKLTIHHIDYDKKNCAPSNLITLCNSCNVRANFNREHYKKFYNNIMNEKYIMKSM